MEDYLSLAISRNTAKGDVATSTIFGETRELLDALEVGDTFTWPNEAFVDIHFSTAPNSITAEVDTPEWKQQWASFLKDLNNGIISQQKAIEDGFKPVYFYLVKVKANEPKPSRVGAVCKLYLKSLNKRVFEYTKDSEGSIVTTGRFITASGNVCRLTQTCSDFGQVHSTLQNKDVEVKAIDAVTTKKFKRKGSAAPEELVQAHTFNLHCDSL